MNEERKAMKTDLGQFQCRACAIRVSAVAVAAMEPLEDLEVRENVALLKV